MTKYPLLVGFLGLSTWLSSSAQSAEYRVAQPIPIVGDGGWDYLTFDASANRLFIARATRVQVVDGDDGHLLGEIPDTPGVHGVALASDLGKGYTSNGRDQSVTVFDLASLKTLRRIATPNGRKPDAILYEPHSRRVLAFNGDSHNATVIDAATDQVVATIALGGAPESAVVDAGGRVFVAIEDRNEVLGLDPVAGKVIDRFPLAGCDEPAGLAIDAKTARLFVGCHNRTMVVVDAAHGTVLAKLPIGDGVDATGFDADRRLAFSSQRDGTLTIVREDDGDRFVVQQSVVTQFGARTMALDPVGHRVYLVTAQFDDAPGTSSGAEPRRVMRPGTLVLLIVRPE